MPKNLHHKYFKDRHDAAKQLYDEIPLSLFKDRELLVVSLSRGGMVIADYLARKLHCSMDILLIEPILAPKNPELPIAMISETQEIVIHKALTETFGIEDAFVYGEAKRVHDKEILPSLYRCRKGNPLQSVSGKAVILVDECVETDFTAIVAVKSMIGLGAKNIYMATPVLDETSRESLLRISDGVFTPYRIRDYISIEYYYEKLEKQDFSELERILDHYE